MHAIDYMVVEKRSDIMKYAEQYAFNNVDRQENPSGSYHGNMTIHDTVCDSYEEAQLRIKGWDTGWYSDHAVQFMDKSALKPTKKMEAVLERRNKLIRDRDAYKQEHSLKNRKAAFIGCKKCGSKLSIEYLKGQSCPLCGNALTADYVVERIKKYNADIRKLDEQFSEMRKKQSGSCPVKWLVKVEVHC